MRLLAVALAAVVIGCGSPVKLLTVSHDGCYLWHAVGLLVADPTYGTTIDQGGSSRPVPVAWPDGFSGRQSGSEVEVVSSLGIVVAVTGRRYDIDGGYADVGSVPSFVTCAESVRPL